MPSLPPTPLPPTIDRLLVFPLPEAHLFPHALLPLHVFEPRYRELARDCLAGDKRMAVPLLAPGWQSDYEGRPPLVPVCGAGEVVQSHRRPDGRYDLLLRGLGRVRIVEELPPSHPYRAVRAVRLDDVRGDERTLREGARALLALVDRVAAVLPSGGDTLRALARQDDDPAALSDVIGAALVTAPEQRQALIEELDVAARLDAVAAIAAELVARLQPLGHGPARN